MDRNANVHVMTFARALMGRTEPGKQLRPDHRKGHGRA
jgi:hypothetical protein